jgi:CheY-like chemotaxis protein
MAEILIIDDDAEFVNTAQILLATARHEIISADTGENGYVIAKKTHPDIILLDVMMTTENEGLEIARRLKEDPATKKIPVLLITGIRSEMSLPLALKLDPEWLPVNSILEKPVKPSVLLEKVEDMLGRES